MLEDNAENWVDLSLMVCGNANATDEGDKKK